jgi:enoyl-CoA hydratase/carnithine racemase
MKGEVVLTEKEDGITTIFLNRPEKRNALDPEIMNALPPAFSAVAEEDDRFGGGYGQEHFFGNRGDMSKYPIRSH